MKDVLEAHTVTMPKTDARKKVAEYIRSVRDRHDAEDEAILRGYRALARGRTLIDLPAVIRASGVHDDNGLPRLAVATSSHEFVWVRRDPDGRTLFLPSHWRDVNPRRRKDVYRMPVGTLPAAEKRSVSEQVGDWWAPHPWDGGMRAMVPHVPPALRPAHSLDGYVTLFEVDRWERDPVPPVDPALLKHIGGDLYAVLAVWDLTDLERSVLAGRTRR